MTTGPDFDVAMTEWLADGPLRAPAGAVEAAIGIASRSSAHPLSGSRLGRRVGSRLTGGSPARGVRPGWALAAVIAVLGMVAAGAVGAWLAERSVVPPDEPVAPLVTSSPSPTEIAWPSSLPPELVGSWSATTSWVLTLTLEPCATGEECGTAQRRDDNGEWCTYDLVYRSRTADVLTFDLGPGNSFGCAWSAWSEGALEVKLVPDDNLRATLRAGASPSFTLHRVDPLSAHADLAGTWSGSPTTTWSGSPTWSEDEVTIAFAACRDGGVCGTGKWSHSGSPCNFTLAHTRTDEGALVFTVESAKEMQCLWGGPEPGSTFRVDPAPDGTLDLRHSGTDHGLPLVTLSRDSGD